MARITNKLTQSDEQGNWSVKGLPWKDTYIGQVITENTHEKVYGALCKLLNYEEAEPNLEKVEELIERDTAKQPVKYVRPNDMRISIYICPNCECRVSGVARFCCMCGQRLDWGGDKYGTAD